MRIRGILLILVASISAISTAYLARGWFAGQRAAILAAIPAPAEVPDLLKILVARVDLPAGIIVQPEHLRWQTWPDDDVPESYIMRDGAEEDAEDAADDDFGGFVGSVVRSGIAAGEPATAVRLVKPGERGFMAAVLTPGMRAVSVQVDEVSGISGFVFPGDRVDILLSHTLRSESEEEAQSKAIRVSETVLTDIRVLAVDQSTDDQATQPEIAKTVTFEVSPKQAEVVAVAIELGRISLSLRSMAQTAEDGEPLPDPYLRRFTWDSEASRVINRGQEGNGVVVMRGSTAKRVAVGS